ncbi:hypothetical protein [Actinomadura oligospora]|uniref:hypothetical protein n=1 Tax=Actinomadura oligospora TaxID=111804 RepID=UPI0012FAF41E|nr:hypothetical protein [Actinomadura oligospora]
MLAIAAALRTLSERRPSGAVRTENPVAVRQKVGDGVRRGEMKGAHVSDRQAEIDRLITSGNILAAGVKALRGEHGCGIAEALRKVPRLVCPAS